MMSCYGENDLSICHQNASNIVWKWSPIKLDGYFSRSGTNPGAINHCGHIFIAIRFTTDTAAPSVVA